MAAWKDKYRQASFRGVQFFVETSDREGGRRGVQHEFAQRDVPYTEDTGRKGRSFNLDGYVLGDDYFTQRDQLITACEAEGPAELVHPYFGRLVVNCFNFKVRESSKDGGIAIFSFSFVEAGQQAFPNASQDTTFNTGSAADALKSASKNSFADKFSVLKQPAFVLKAAADKVKAFSAQVETVSKTFSSAAADLTELSFTLRKLTANVNDLLATPDKLAEQMGSALGFLRTASGSAEDSFNGLKGMLGFGSDDKPVAITTSTRQKQFDNQKALNDMIKQIAVAEAVQSAIEVPFDSVEDAEAARSDLIGAIDDQMVDTTSDDVYAAQQDLMARMIQSLPPPNQALSRIGTVTKPKTTNSLILAYDVYESPSLESDIITRNKISNPAFILGGRELKILRTDDV
jgi:prophage DNA circulation protein